MVVISDLSFRIWDLNLKEEVRGFDWLRERAVNQSEEGKRGLIRIIFEILSTKMMTSKSKRIPRNCHYEKRTSVSHKCLP